MFLLKKKKNRHALLEIIRAISLSKNFVELSFKPIDLTMAVKKFKFMENYNSWKMYFEVQILTLDIFTLILPPPSPLPRITPAASRDHDLEY